MTTDAARFVATTISDPKEPLIIFALEWCEFCWSVKKFCDSAGIHYITVDLDSVPYQADALGRRIRDALAERTGIKTIPQIFIGGEFVGGCTDFFDGWKSGQIQELLSQAGIVCNDTADIDPYAFLPEWLHPR